jgi:hypothetical protein
MMDDLRRLWQEHLEAPYPEGCRPRRDPTIDLAMIDADIAACVSTFLSREGRLDCRRTAILGRRHRDAALVAQELDGSACDYFKRLERMAAVVLEALSVDPTA